ncbi:MAG TPA: peptidylprolyl isomerase [Candidatus Treponema faecavium]|nr:peptidylprolyl isomerase [Candidatus Treponema faecavium]
MKIEKNKVVSIEYVLKDADGEILDSSEDMGALEYIHGRGDLIAGLERELEGKAAGEKLSVVVEPADAYGEYNRELVVEVPRSQFDDSVDIEAGMQFEAESAEGSHLVTVVDVKDGVVVVDANHPLAGEKLFFDVEIKDVRDATEEELNRGLHDEGCGCGGHECGEGCGGGCCGCGH